MTLIDPYKITSTHEPYIALCASDGREVARITFELTVVFGMFKTSVVIRNGAIEAVETEPCSVTVTLAVKGYEPPLLERELPFRIRLTGPRSPSSGSIRHQYRDHP